VEVQAAPSGHLLRARSVSWSVDGCDVLRPLDFGVAIGECVAVVGPNGAGKTTLLRLLAGVLEPSGGELTWAGTPYGRMSRRELARHIGYVPQVRPASIPLTVEQLVLLGRYPYLSPFQMAPGPEDLESVARVLERSGLAGLRERQLDGLSGGERQSVFIAATLAQEAEVLLLDEPTTHLDPRHHLDVVGLLMDLRSSGGQTIVLTTHDVNLAARLADRIVALRDGRVVAEGSPAELVRPDRLFEIFGAPFEAVGGAGGPRVLLRLDR
jgi:iron complex transport system ATP-binding protein